MSGPVSNVSISSVPTSGVVVVGAQLGGLRVCETLRSEGYDGRITLVGAEERLPYDRPPLSKEVLGGKKEPEFAELTRPGEWAELDLDLRLGRRAVRLDPADHQVVLDDGQVLSYDKVVLATGARPRTLAIPGVDLTGVHVLRTMEDCLAIRAGLTEGPRLVVIGAGFIGCEVAATAAAMGVDVTVLEFLPTPLFAALGEDIGRIVEGIHRDHGVAMRCGVAATELRGDDRVEEVVLSDGTRHPADLVVIGVGVVPETDWLDGSGITVQNGVVCDEKLQAVGHPDVLAVGDLVRWQHPKLGRDVRVEHWTHASESASFAAGQILGRQPDGASAVYDPVPYVWSDQHGQRIQIIGLPQSGDRAHIVHGAPGEPKLVVLYEGGGRLTAAVSFNHPGRLMRYRPLLVEPTPWERAEALAAELGP